jgi:acid phosphatase
VRLPLSCLCGLALAGACGRHAPARSAEGRDAPNVPPPQFSHVIIVVEENRNYSDVIGSSAAPYLNRLARQYGLATQYYANTHPSIGNYFMLAVGDTITNNDGYSGVVTRDNVVRELLAAGKTWKSYAEDLPAVGYTGPGRRLYARKHNVFALLSDVVNDTAQVKHLVPFTQFAADLKHDSLPNYAFIVPNLCNDGHNCRFSVADRWLQTNIEPLIRSPTFQRGGLLIITFDESRADGFHGGGQVALVVVSSKSKRAYQSVTFYQHESTLRLTLQALGASAFPNRAATATEMGEFFGQ